MNVVRRESDSDLLFDLYLPVILKGDKGDKGDTPVIGANGNWYIAGKDTGKPSRGIAPTVGANGNWFIGDQDTGVLARAVNGVDGKDGKDVEYIFKRTREHTRPATPFSPAEDDKFPEEDGWTDDPKGVGPALPYEWVSKRFKINGEWQKFSPPALWAKYSFDGKPGQNGKDGRDGATPEIGENGNWWIGGVDTGKPSRGREGESGASVFENTFIDLRVNPNQTLSFDSRCIFHVIRFYPSTKAEENMVLFNQSILFGTGHVVILVNENGNGKSVKVKNFAVHTDTYELVSGEVGLFVGINPDPHPLADQPVALRNGRSFLNIAYRDNNW